MGAAAVSTTRGRGRAFLQRFIHAAAMCGVLLAAGGAGAQSCLPAALRGRTLFNLPGGTGGVSSQGGLVFREGALYGVTSNGGAADAGTIYRLTPPVPPSTAWTRTYIHVFRGGADGASPTNHLVLDSAGALYGTTLGGGSGGNGVVFSLTPPVPPSTVWIKKILYSFQGGSDSAAPVGGLVFDSAGALYSVTKGRLGTGDRGAVFRLTPPVPPATRWTNTILYRFAGGADGSDAIGNLAIRGGAIYGVTQDLGDTGRGTVYRLDPPVPPATLWTKTIIHRFRAIANNQWPLPSSVIFDTAGALYGATQGGGAFGFGTVFKLTRSSSTEWTHATLYSFRDAPGGRQPSSSLVFDTAGALYGMTAWGGASAAGAVYRLTPPAPPSTDWTESVLYSFRRWDGLNPSAGLVSSLIFDTTGALYGMTASGGWTNSGVVFQLSR